MTQQLVTKIERQPVHEELAEWFLKSGGDFRTSEEIVDKIIEIKEKNNRQAGEVIRKEYQQFLTQARLYLLRKYRKALVGFRISNDRYFAYKIANDEEATIEGVKRVKRFVQHADIVELYIPVMKRKYMWASVQKVFGTAQEAIERFQRAGEKFRVAYDQDYKVVKQLEREQKKLEQKNGEGVSNNA